MGTDKVVFEGDRTIAHAWPEEALFESIFCACATGSCSISVLVGPSSPEVSHVTGSESRDRKRLCPALLFFPVFVFPYLFPSTFFSRTIFLQYYFPVLFQKSRRLKSNVLKYQWVVFSSTCRYNTVHVPCGIFIQTSPVGFPLDGWGARKRDPKGSKMNLFNLKEDWNVL
jgi:hypothetical protein